MAASETNATPVTSSTTSPEAAQANPSTIEEVGAKAQAADAPNPTSEDVPTEVLDAVVDESEVVAQAKAEVAEWQDKYMRLHAEWDTYRRRTNEQRELERARATEKLVESLLPVLDDFERTISYAQENGESGLLGGVEAVYAKLNSALEKDGLQTINPEGEAFDALAAQAVATVEDPSVPDETVAQVYQKGYRMGEKVLRPAMVSITSGGPKRTSE